jgi:hypothetical protein
MLRGTLAIFRSFQDRVIVFPSLHLYGVSKSGRNCPKVCGSCRNKGEVVLGDCLILGDLLPVLPEGWEFQHGLLEQWGQPVPLLQAISMHPNELVRYMCQRFHTKQVLFL